MKQEMQAARCRTSPPPCSAVPWEGADDTWRGKLRDLSALWRLRPAYVCMDCGRTFSPPFAKWKNALHRCTPNNAVSGGAERRTLDGLVGEEVDR